MLFDFPAEILLNVVIYIDVQTFVRLGNVSVAGKTHTHLTSKQLLNIWMRYNREVSDYAFIGGYGGLFKARSGLMFYSLATLFELDYLMGLAKDRRSLLLKTLMDHVNWTVMFVDMYPDDALPTWSEICLYGHRALIVKQLDLMDATVVANGAKELAGIIMQQANIYGLLFNACVASRARLKKRRLYVM